MGLPEDRAEPRGRLVELGRAVAGRDVERLGGFVGGQDAGSEPRVVPVLGPGPQPGGVAQAAGELADPLAPQARQGRPVEPDPGGRGGLPGGQLGQGLLHLVHRDAPRVTHGVHGPQVRHQTGAPVPEDRHRDVRTAGVRSRHVQPGHVTVLSHGPLQGACELLGGCAAVGHAVVGIEDEVAQAESVEPPEDRVDGGALLRDEEGGLALGRERGDQVGDGL